MDTPSAPDTQFAPTRKEKLQWTLALGLCAATLVAAWITAQRRKEEKLAARAAATRIPEAEPGAALRLRLGADGRLLGLPTPTLSEFLGQRPPGHPLEIELDPRTPGESQREVLREAEGAKAQVRFVLGQTGLARIGIRRGERLRIENFILEAGREPNTIQVDTAEGAPLARYSSLAKGHVRRWMEFQMTFLEAGPEVFTIEIELKPSAPCFGSGLYRVSRAGLRVEFSQDRSCTITAVQHPGPRLTAAFERGGDHEVRNMGPDAEGEACGIHYALPGGNSPSKEVFILLEER